MTEKDRIAAGIFCVFSKSRAFPTLSVDDSFATGFFYLTLDVMIAPIFYSGEDP